VAIERALGDGVVVISFTLPGNAGGQLDAVRQIVGEAIVGLQQINVNTVKAAIDYAKGERAYAAGSYRTAYDWYVSAYQRLLK